MSMALLRRCLPAVALLTVAACSRPAATPAKPAVDSTAYAADTRDWRAKRLDAIAGAEGWSTVAGFFWLDSAESSIGNAPGNRVLLAAEHTPPHLGTLSRTDRGFVFRAHRTANVTVDGARIDSVVVADDKSEKPTVLQNGSVTYRVIERGGRFALRVKDTAYVLRREFKGLEYLPVDTALRVHARFTPHPTPQTVRILNVLGQTEAYRSPGTLEFTVGGAAYSLTATFEGKDTTQYFILLRDATSRDLTYPAGRFMYVPLADSTGYTILDFNRAINPPCAFTAFATCPLPPAQNVLSVALRAGEKRYAGPHGSTIEPRGTR